MMGGRRMGDAFEVGGDGTFFFFAFRAVRSLISFMSMREVWRRMYVSIIQEGTCVIRNFY